MDVMSGAENILAGNRVSGAENISEAEQKEVDDLLNSPSVQKEFCDYLIHSGETFSC